MTTKTEILTDVENFVEDGVPVILAVNLCEIHRAFIDMNDFYIFAATHSTSHNFLVALVSLNNPEHVKIIFSRDKTGVPLPEDVLQKSMKTISPRTVKALAGMDSLTETTAGLLFETKIQNEDKRDVLDILLENRNCPRLMLVSLIEEYVTSEVWLTNTRKYENNLKTAMSNQQLLEEDYEHFYNVEHFWMDVFLAGTSRVAPGILTKIFNDYKNDDSPDLIIEGLAGNSSTPEKILTEILNLNNQKYNNSLAKNPSITVPQLKRLVKKGNIDTLSNISRFNLRPEITDELIEFQMPEVIVNVAGDETVSPEKHMDMIMMAPIFDYHVSIEIYKNIASLGNIKEEVFDYLHGLEIEEVTETLHDNPVFH